MRDRKNFVLIFLALAIALPLGLSSLPLWLDAPARSNPHDPKSIEHLTDGPSAVPTSAGTPFTKTDTKTITETKTPVPGTATRTPVPSSPTKTVTPGGVVPSFTFTPGALTCLLTDFEEEGTNDRDLWGGTIYTETSGGGADTSTINPSTWMPTGSASTPLGTGHGSTSLVGRITGLLAAQNVSPTYIYPHCDMVMELVTGGAAHPAATDIDVDVAPFCQNNGISFDYRAGNASISYRLELVQAGSTNNGYYQFSWTPPDTNWHTLTIYFPSVSSALVSKFSQPGWATVFPWTTKIGALQFQVNPTGADQNYDLSIDNVTFCVAGAPTPVPTPTFATITSGDGHVIMDFEDNGLQDNLNCALTSLPYQGPAIGGNGGGSTMNPPWDQPGTGLGSAPGNGGSAYCATFYGTVVSGGWSVFEMRLSNGGCFTCNDGNGGPLAAGGFVDLTTLCPSKRIRFDYRANNDANGDGRGKVYAMQWETQNITDYDYYEIDFTAANDTNWHTVIAYWPSSSFTPQLAPAYCDYSGCGGSGAGPFSFDPAHTGEFEFRVVPQASPVSFNISLDNVIVD